MLGITDSCVGGKVALNYKNTKNIMALFSAPRKVILCLDFLNMKLLRSNSKAFPWAVFIYTDCGSAW